MILVDLDMLKMRMYHLGRAKKQIPKDDNAMIKALDSWQKREVLNSYNKGSSDA